MKEYLSTDKLTLQQKQLLFNLRTRMVLVKCNYKRKYEGNLLCTLCDTQSEESQEHLLVCPALLEDIVVDKSVNYMDIFGTLEKQVKAARYFSQIISVRKVKLKEQKTFLKGETMRTVSNGASHI